MAGVLPPIRTSFFETKLGETRISWDWVKWFQGLESRTGRIGASQALFSDNETPAGAVDGVNLIFTLANAPNPAGSLILVLDKQVQVAGVDYTLAGKVITFILAPALGGKAPAAWYRY